MKKKWILWMTIALLPLSSAAQVRDDKAQMLKGSGFVDFQSMSFEETKGLYTVTGMYRTDKDEEPDMYSFWMTPESQGSSMNFQVHKTCELTGHLKEPPNRIVLVNGQKINTVYQCLANSTTGQRREIYLVITDEAQGFIAGQFLKAPRVMVEIGHVTVPLSTGGFSAARARASGKAL